MSSIATRASLLAKFDRSTTVLVLDTCVLQKGTIMIFSNMHTIKMSIMSTMQALMTATEAKNIPCVLGLPTEQLELPILHLRHP